MAAGRLESQTILSVLGNYFFLNFILLLLLLLLLSRGEVNWLLGPPKFFKFPLEYIKNDMTPPKINISPDYFNNSSRVLVQYNLK